MTNSSSKPVDETAPRLDRNVQPLRYSITIKTDLANQVFSGTAEISIQLTKAAPSIVLNTAAPLALQAAVLSHHSDNSTRLATSFKYDVKTERTEIAFAGGDVEAGEATIGLRWEAKFLEDAMTGYYLATFPNKNVTERTCIYAQTMLEGTAARKVFPCFDDVALKAEFSISMISRTGLVSISNMNAAETTSLGSGGAFPRTDLLDDAFFESTIHHGLISGGSHSTRTASKSTPKSFLAEAHDDWELVTFAPTPKMSPHLIAFANGDFEHIEGIFTSEITSKVIPVRVYATWDQIKTVSITLETQLKALPLYEKMFDLEYPLPKLDTLVTSNLDSGAMENWGLIVALPFRASFSEGINTLADKKAVVDGQAHETGHMWFGDLVTFSWWNDVWLNESFASYVGEFIVADLLEPSWKRHSEFLTEFLARALKIDGLRSSHPIELPSVDESSIGEVFDFIAYDKGPSILRMLCKMIGQETFFQGVSKYLKRHLYGNSTTLDLWNAISEASGLDIATIMSSWTSKTGFPVVTVEETPEGLKVRQNRFLCTGDATEEEDQTIWHIPLELLKIDSNGKQVINHSVVLKSRETMIPMNDIESAVFKLNADTSGVYRVLYSPSRLDKLGEQIGNFSLNDRLGIIQDATELASSGYSNTSTALNLINKMRGDNETLVWKVISDFMGKLSDTWWEQSEDDRAALARFRQSLFAPILAHLGFENSEDEDLHTTDWRAIAISNCAQSGDSTVHAECKRRFDGDESGIPPNLRESIFCTSVAEGGRVEHSKILDIFRISAGGVRRNAIKGLCSSRDRVLINETLQIMVSDETSTDDLHWFFEEFSGNPAAKRALWGTFKSHYSDLDRKAGGKFLITHMVQHSISGFSSEDDIQDVKSFFSQYDTSRYKQALAQTIESVHAKAAWLKRDVEDVRGWLKAHGYSA